jgi:hypothetical protein
MNRSGAPFRGCSRLPFRLRLLSRSSLARDPFREFLAAGLAIPFLERFVRDLSLDEQLRELAPLRLALERHPASAVDDSIAVTR